ncbi:MAG: phosphoribosylglycinamide formyltransferase [Myxococcota bacterium]
MTRVCAFASGRGSNLRALVEAHESGRCAAEVVAVVSDRSDAPALAFAKERRLATHVVPFRRQERDAWNRQLAEAFTASEATWAVLAGFMRIVGTPLLETTGGRIVNVHPSLLPAFPGLHAPAQAIAAGVRVSGCTVHLVDGGVDTGPVLAQASVPVFQDDDETALHARIQQVEHQLLPFVLDAIALGRLDERARWRDGGRSVAERAWR